MAAIDAPDCIRVTGVRCGLLCNHPVTFVHPFVTRSGAEHG